LRQAATTGQRAEVDAEEPEALDQKLLPAKTRAFVDFVIEQFRAQQLAQRFRATAGVPA
jgi:hypothetical protein